MNRVYLTTIIAVLAVAAALGAAYQFYFKAKIDLYNQHAQQQQQLLNKLNQMHSTFEGVKPNVVVSEWKRQVNPWFASLGQEGQFFDFGVEDVPPVPEEVVSPRLYYEDQYNKMITEIQQEAYPRPIPFTNFGVYAPNQIPNNTASPEEVRLWLRKLAFGNEMLRLLLDHGAIAISDIDVWPDKPEQDGLVIKRTVGAQFYMSVSDLADFLEDLRAADQYYTVEALRITNPYLLNDPAPAVQVEMLLTLAWFNKGKLDEAGRRATASSYASPQAAFEDFGIRQGSGREVQQPSGFSRWWRNFRKRYLPF